MITNKHTRRLEIAARRLLKAYSTTNTCLDCRLDAEEAFVAAERKYLSSPAAGAMLHHRAKAYLAAIKARS